MRATFALCGLLLLLGASGCSPPPESSSSAATEGWNEETADFGAIAEQTLNRWTETLSVGDLEGDALLGFADRLEPGGFRWITKKRARFEVDLPAGVSWSSFDVQVSPLHAPTGPPQTVEVTVDGRPAGTESIDARWGFRTLRFEPEERLGPGRHRVDMRIGWTRRVSELQPGAGDNRELGLALKSVTFHAEPSANIFRDGHLHLTGGGTLSWMELVPKGGSLSVSSLRGPGQLRITLTEAGEAPTELAAIKPTVEAVEVGIPGRDDPVRLRLVAEGGPVTIRDVELKRWIEDPPTADPGALGLAEGPEAAAAPPNVIVYVVDSLRADHLGVYGYADGTSPALDRFAEQATLFLHPSAQSSWTRTGVASILTGADPWQHGVQGRLDALADDVPFLPELLAARGYRTAGFVTNGNLSAGFGFSRGFETYEHLPETTSEWVHVPSADLHARVLEWIDDGRDDPRPFFLYIHSTDPHYPYRLDLGAEETVPLKSPQWGSVARVVDLQLGRAQAEIGELEATVELYDREIAYNDHHFGLLVDSLRDRGLWRDALMVYTADHGEEFLDHGGWGHGQTLELEQLHVPLVIRFPRQSQGLRIGNLVSQNDIAPTILGYLGATWPDGRGQSLMPLVRPEPVPWNRVSLASLQLDGFSLASARFGTFFWIEKSATDGKFIHLTADPFGHRDQSASFPGWRDYLSAILARAPQPRASTAVTPDREVEKTLKSLGYI